MFPRWAKLSKPERDAFWIATRFLEGRLEQRQCIEWALRLGDHQEAERLAISELLDAPSASAIKSPWREAWRIIEEGWQHRVNKDANSLRIHAIKNSLERSDFSGAVLSQIVNLVRPVIVASTFSRTELRFRKIPKRPNNVSDILSVSLGSGQVVSPAELGLDKVRDSNFLHELANELSSAVVKGLDAARRLGWNTDGGVWQLGSLHRVYFTKELDRVEDDHEPDEFHDGIAPSVKLLHAVVAKLLAVDTVLAKRLATSWRDAESIVLNRLWCALARDEQFASDDEVASFLFKLDDRGFWDIDACPEMAELRAARFARMTREYQVKLTDRIRRLPPRSLWRRGVDQNKREEARVHWAARELRRIEIGNGVLEEEHKKWLENSLAAFGHLRDMRRLDEGFPSAASVRKRTPVPDRSYDLLEGVARLEALESALGSKHRSWDDSPEQRAYDWIREPGQTSALLVDLEGVPDSGAMYPKVWHAFTWADSVPGDKIDNPETTVERQRHASRVIALISSLPLMTARQAIDGITYWLAGWRGYLEDREMLLREAIRLWPLAAEATNQGASKEIANEDREAAQTTSKAEARKIDTLNAPVSRIVAIFLSKRPKMREGDRPFDVDVTLRALRDVMIAEEGRSRFIACYRLLEHLPWFMVADPDWAETYLLTPLAGDDIETRSLWRAVAGRTHFDEVLSVLGKQMAKQATNIQLDRDTRKSLAWSIVIECLHAFLDDREPAIPYASAQQMIRSLADEVRANAAEAPQKFVRDLSLRNEERRIPAEVLLAKAVSPFLRTVWPQERSLATPGVARALADLPATCGDAFVEAVDLVERFLVPFDCWSMVQYGLYGEDQGKPKLEIICDDKRAEGLLRLLNSTVGFAEGAVIPVDLASALEQIRKTSSKLEADPRFRRLAAVARRT